MTTDIAKTTAAIRLVQIPIRKKPLAEPTWTAMAAETATPSTPETAGCSA
ncbi:Uncharacterised protein [Mycobacteroides abscessus subsp. abscessus]|nr:Uncharacterised protein [Mycobacteroides abscessus subsp. abscessus]